MTPTPEVTEGTRNVASAPGVYEVTAIAAVQPNRARVRGREEVLEEYPAINDAMGDAPMESAPLGGRLSANPLPQSNGEGHVVRVWGMPLGLCLIPIAHGVYRRARLLHSSRRPRVVLGFWPCRWKVRRMGEINVCEEPNDLQFVCMMEAVNGMMSECVTVGALTGEFMCEVPLRVDGSKSGMLLDEPMVKQGRELEIQRMNEFEELSLSDVDGKLINGDWLDHIKETEGGAVVRSRFVAEEVAYERREDNSAGTPALYMLKPIASLAATRPSVGKRRSRLVACYDILSLIHI